MPLCEAVSHPRIPQNCAEIPVLNVAKMRDSVYTVHCPWAFLRANFHFVRDALSPWTTSALLNVFEPPPVLQARSASAREPAYALELQTTNGRLESGDDTRGSRL